MSVDQQHHFQEENDVQCTEHFISRLLKLRSNII